MKIKTASHFGTGGFKWHSLRLLVQAMQSATRLSFCLHYLYRLPRPSKDPRKTIYYSPVYFGQPCRKGTRQPPASPIKQK
ncbi:hypothetical protein BO94DRAFT_118309 [Aspergillus sclerotioniger CBS 115572]|uniref:Uncharacterized protein n=1 Tax=Aspergillus sclerotioniger CBS 115572 TaxID=1450535 RepID=A0A317W9R1_9EURO|nr:hypothetical protein BO94DRAFT_118309 [Aspergillus sclerotioniger CBS 115572]PWY83093.1 hypothetical protein BO94DRAFT_118309 [Aspergillus sclerotioniger CBS 115572]